MGMAHYAEAFEPGQCFRFIDDHSDRAQHCPRPLEWLGRFKDGAGKWHEVDACVEHDEEVSAPRLIRI